MSIKSCPWSMPGDQDARSTHGAVWNAGIASDPNSSISRPHARRSRSQVERYVRDWPLGESLHFWMPASRGPDVPDLSSAVFGGVEDSVSRSVSELCECFKAFYAEGARIHLAGSSYPTRNARLPVAPFLKASVSGPSQAPCPSVHECRNYVTTALRIFTDRQR